MYYKIENKESEVYQQLFKMRSDELIFEEENKQAIKDFVGLDFSDSLGYSNQNSFSRTTEYIGFQFTEPEKVNLKDWRRDNDYPDVFIPNRKSKRGREISDFIRNGLKRSSFKKPFKILGLPITRRFTFPYIEIAGELVLVRLSDTQEPKSSDLIEITRSEFIKILEAIQK